VTAPPVLETPLLPRTTTPRGRTRRGILGHSPALDGLRGIALILVLVYHFTGVTGPLPGGWSGVDVFFVLSGFLITALILDERKLLGRVDLGRFYARRGLRLLPALLVMLTIWSGLLLLFHGSNWFGAVPNGGKSGGTVDVGPALGHVALVLTYGINWVHAIWHGHAPLGHLWSLAVEEQFYLVWPFTLLVFLRLPSARRVWPVLTLALASAALPFFLYDGGAGKNRIYFGTDTRAVGLLLGAAAALIWHRRRSRGRAARLGGCRLRRRGRGVPVEHAGEVRHRPGAPRPRGRAGRAVPRRPPDLDHGPAAVAAAAGVGGQAVLRALPLALPLGDVDASAAAVLRDAARGRRRVGVHGALMEVRRGAGAALRRPLQGTDRRPA
jgi:hypothetical protein